MTLPVAIDSPKEDVEHTIPSWTHSGEEIGAGTDTAGASFTLSHGILNSITSHPVDYQLGPRLPRHGQWKACSQRGKPIWRPNSKYIDDHALGYRFDDAGPEKRYRIIKKSSPTASAPASRSRAAGRRRALLENCGFSSCFAHLGEGPGWAAARSGSTSQAAARRLPQRSPGPQGLDPLSHASSVRRHEQRLDPIFGGILHGLGVRSPSTGNIPHHGWTSTFPHQGASALGVPSARRPRSHDHAATSPSTSRTKTAPRSRIVAHQACTVSAPAADLRDSDGSIEASRSLLLAHEAAQEP